MTRSTVDNPAAVFDLPAPPPACSGRYPGGQCTSGAAYMFPIVCTAPNMGNGGDWYASAVGFGWPHEAGVAHVGWLASFNVAPPYGDVGLITGLNADGTVQRFGANWHLDGKWSSDAVPAELIIGSFLPLGAFVDPTRGQLLEQLRQTGEIPRPQAEATGARGLPCRFAWRTPEIPLVAGQKIGSQSICFDGVVGGAAWLLGAGLVVAALIVAARRPIQRAGGRAAQVGGTATGQPEVAAAGTAVRSRAARPQRSRSLAGGGSVQEQETYRDIRGLGGGRSTYSPVQARRMAQAAGSEGTREERLRRALLSTQQ